ncbi:DUF2487 family protein [Niallia sp. Krafla_26]|uniref:DUF2487 family protein n=1 Tax=Niallia sp. Krafla_26 TaxID=3064703 RepID=UPI003D173F2F
MKWTGEDMDMFTRAKEYIDTVILPLCPVSFQENLDRTVEMTDYISFLVHPLEKQFKGRLLLLPSFTYLKPKEGDLPIELLLNWEEELRASGFNYIFYLTSDQEWQTKESALNGSIVCMPSVPIRKHDLNDRNTILEDQVKQIRSLFTEKWQQSKQV